MMNREEIKQILIDIIKDKKTPSITVVEAIREYNSMLEKEDELYHTKLRLYKE